MSYKKPIFEGVPKKNVNKSTFNLSHEWKCAYVPGYIQPVMLLETLPGDEWSINSEFFFRFSPLFYPLMQKFTMRCNYFKVPYRILWYSAEYPTPERTDWTSWITEMSDLPLPTCIPDCGVPSNGDQFNYKLASKFGLPELTYTPPPNNLVTTVGPVVAFPFSAYLKIWDWYYRIPQLEDERFFPLESGDNTNDMNSAFGVSAGQWTMFSSKWEQDYFTAALPTPQIGDAITIPISDDVTTVRRVDGGTVANAVPLEVGNGTSTERLINADGDNVIIDNAATIRDLRLAETLQHYYERIMKVGQRYRDFIKGLWGNDPQPGLIDSPVLFGSKFGRVQISDVMAQADTAYSEQGTRYTGDYVGQASLYSHDNEMMNVYCEEHGLIMALLEMNPNTSYGQGVHRMWRRFVQTDYALDLFAGIGDQEILKEEVYFSWPTADAAKNQDTFGYIPRFSEYRYFPNMAVSEMQRGTGLSQHLGRHWDGNYMGSGGGMDDLSISNAFTNVGVSNLNLEPDDNADNGHIRNTDVFRALPAKPESNTSFEGIVFCHIYHEIYVKRNLPFFSTPKL